MLNLEPNSKGLTLIMVGFFEDSFCGGWSKITPRLKVVRIRLET